MKRHRFLAAVHSIMTGDEEHLATFYLMNTTVNRNGWGVSDKALEEAMPTILRKPIGCGPGYMIDAHYPEPLDLGRFVAADKPDGYGLGTAEITDATAWEHLITGEWGPISVVILSYRDICSNCGEDLTQTEEPFSHDCIARREAYLLVESFVFERVDFIDTPAVPQAGVINVAGAQTEVSLELCARFYESQSKQDPAQGPGAHSGSNPEEKEEKKRLEAQIEELRQQLDDMKTENTTLKTDNDSLKGRVQTLEAERHQERLEAALDSRAKAGLVADREAEAERLKKFDDSTLDILREDAEKVAEKMAKAPPTGPKTKYTKDSKDAFEAAVEDKRMELFGHRREAEA